MTWYERIIAAHTAVTSEVSHAAHLKSDRYFVWQEDVRDDLISNGVHTEKTMCGTTHLFTKTEFDPWASLIETEFEKAGIPYEYEFVEYEEDTGFFHHSWDWVVW